MFQVHLILDNYATHKTPAIKQWLLAHPRMHLHFTPTGSSWLNLVERWFAELTQKKLRRGVHRSIQVLERDIRLWLANWNDNLRPFIWTKTADEISRPAVWARSAQERANPSARLSKWSGWSMGVRLRLQGGGCSLSEPVVRITSQFCLELSALTRIEGRMTRWGCERLVR